MSDDIIDLGLFFGTNDSYEEYKRKNQLKDTEDDIREKEVKKVAPSNAKKDVLALDTLKPISDETMKILRRTRCAHVYDEVYMQSSLDFYDEYYNDTEASPELKAARQIRRVYKKYSEYLDAIRIRIAYIDTLVDKYGGEDQFSQKLSMGLVKDWIPPNPTLSKRCPDYEMFISGMIPLPTQVAPEGTANKVLESMLEELSDTELEISFDVETSIGVINNYKDITESEYADHYNRDISVSRNDMDSLNKVFRSWYKSEDNTSNKHELFKNAPENIKKRFLEYCAYNEPGLLTRLKNGEEIKEPEPNPNEMVHDSKTGKAMTRREFENRELIRLQAKFGWSESRLLNYSQIGSKLERASRKKKARKKRSGLSTNAFDAINSPNGLDPMYSDNDYLMESLSSMMRGD